MINVNLLPVEQKHEASKKQLKILASAILYAIATGLLVVTVLFFFITKVSQKNRIEDLKDATDTALIKLQGEPEIDKLLTIQNQLTAIPQLHNSKAIPTRIFDYLDKIVPADVTLTDVTIGFAPSTGGGGGGADPGGAGPEEPTDDLVVRSEEFEIVKVQAGGGEGSQNQIMISGITRDFKTLNTFVDIIKNAEFTAKSPTNLEDGAERVETELTKAFTNVKTNSSGKQDEVTLSFSLTFDYNPQLFDFTITQIIFSVPSKITTVSEQERPTGLFVDDPFDEEDTSGGGL